MFLLNFALFLGVLITLTAATAEPSNVSVQLITSADMKRILQEYPDAQPLSVQILPEKLTKGTGEVDEARSNLVYTLGGRVNGDKLVVLDQKNYSWASPKDVRLLLTYPASGVGAIVSYLEIRVSQSSNLGQAYVVAGGIGQRTIIIAVEALNTLWFNSTFLIYGY